MGKLSGRSNRFKAFRNRFMKRAAPHGTGRAFLKALFKRYRNKAFMRKLSGRSNRFKAFRNRFMKRSAAPGRGRAFLKALFKKYRMRHGAAAALDQIPSSSLVQEGERRNRFQPFRD